MRLFALLVCAMTSTTASAVTVTWGSGGPPSYLTQRQQQYVLDTLTAQFSSQIMTQTQLARGLANAGSFASDAGTLAGHQNYDLFAIMAGPMVGVQFPQFHLTSPTGIYNQLKTTAT